MAVREEQRDPRALDVQAEAFAEDFYGRLPGSDTERRAARRLQGRLRELGREAQLEPFAVWPRWPVAHSLHALVAIGGSVLAVREPAPGAALVLAATLLTFIDVAGLVPTTRRLLGRRFSQNVVSWGAREAPGVLLVAAHYDAGRAGLVRSQRWERRQGALGRLGRRSIGSFEPFFWALVLLLACCLLRLTGLEGTLLTAVQFAPTVALVLAVPFLLDIVFAGPVGAENDNASGVALALRLAERFGGRLEHFELHVLLSGSQKAMAQGSRAFLKRYRGVLDRERVVFLNLDAVGAGSVRYTRREGAIVTAASHRQLIALCAEIGEDDDASQARALTNRAPSDGYAARSAGFPGITITCRDALDCAPRRIDSESLAVAESFCAELIRRVDAELGPRLSTLSPSAE